MVIARRLALPLILFILLFSPALAQEPIVGEIRVWPVDIPPDGWAICDGQALSTTTYPELSSLIKTYYGGGTGYFNVPNLKGRNPIGRDASISAMDTIGETGGSLSHALSVGELPPHSHDAYTYYGGGGTHNWSISGGGNNQAGLLSGSTGSGNSFSVMDPYLTLNFIIFTGVYSATPTPTATATPTNTPTPTATPTGSVTPTATPTNTLYLPSVYTQTLSSGKTLTVPVQADVGQVITAGLVLSLIAVFAFDFLYRAAFRR